MIVDVAVVGAGVVGASIAYRLGRAGARVTLIDRGVPGGGTSAASFAWVNANDKAPLPYHQLNAAGVAAHRRLRDDVAGDAGAPPAAAAPAGPAVGVEKPWLYEGGGLEWTDTVDGRRRLLEKVERLQSWGYRITLLDEAEVQVLEPHLDLTGLTAAAFALDEAWVDGPVLAAGVAAAATRHGVEIKVGSEVVGFDQEGQRLSAVRLASDERVAADWIVLAAGRWTEHVASLAGVHVPLAPTYGLLAVTSPLAQRASRVVHVPGMNFRPEPGGGLVLQSGETDETVGPDTPADAGLPGCARLLERAERFLPAVDGARIVEARIGVRPMPADGFSIVGPVEQRPGLYLAVTHSGVTLAPILGELIAAEITTGHDSEHLAHFRPARCVRVS